MKTNHKKMVKEALDTIALVVIKMPVMLVLNPEEVSSMIPKVLKTIGAMQELLDIEAFSEFEINCLSKMVEEERNARRQLLSNYEIDSLIEKLEELRSE